MLTRRLRAVICFRTDWGCALSFDGGACQAGASREPRPYRTTITGRSWIYPAGGMLGIFIHFGVRFCQFFLEMYSFRVSYSHRADITPHSVAGQMGQKMRARKIGRSKTIHNSRLLAKTDAEMDDSSKLLRSLSRTLYDLEKCGCMRTSRASLSGLLFDDKKS